MVCFRARFLLNVSILCALTGSAGAAMIVQEVQLKNRTAVEFMEELRARPLQDGFTAILDPSSAMALRVSGEEKQFPKVLERIQAWDQPYRRFFVTYEVRDKGSREPFSGTVTVTEGKTASALIGKRGEASTGFQVSARWTQRGLACSVELLLGQATATLPFQIAADTVITFTRRDVEATPWVYMTLLESATGKKRTAQVPYDVWAHFIDSQITIKIAPVPK